MNDFGNLARYRAADAALGPPGAGEDRVVFFGDTITENWDLERYFPGERYINRGISGQTTPQLLVRFRQDVVDLQPRIVFILAGMNDIAGYTRPIADDDIERNYKTLGELAHVHNIVPVFASITPMNEDFLAHRQFFNMSPSAETLNLNAWLKQYCATNRYIYVDYFSKLADARGLLRPEFSEGGPHMNVAAYQTMAPLARSAIDQALKK
jgi:lysophospholipase L1-like esterase